MDIPASSQRKLALSYTRMLEARVIPYFDTVRRLRLAEITPREVKAFVRWGSIRRQLDECWIHAKGTVDSVSSAGSGVARPVAGQPAARPRGREAAGPKVTMPAPTARASAAAATDRESRAAFLVALGA